MTILQGQEMARRQLPNVCKESMRIRCPEERKILIEGFNVQLSLEESGCEDGFYLRRKDERIIVKAFGLRIVEGLNSHSVTHQRQGSFFIVPDGECEHPVQTRQAINSPFLPGAKQYLGVRLRFENVMVGFQRSA